jgi:hypothetical protein
VAALAASEWRIIGPKMVSATAELVRPGGRVTASDPTGVGGAGGGSTSAEA